MPIDLDDPIALMLAAAAALERSGAASAAYGGLALGMYGEPRETRDADFAVTGVDVERARLALADLGVKVVIAFANVLRGHEIRVTSPEDFVILKVLATRDRDLEDARSVFETQGRRLDEALIRAEIERLIEEIPDHDIRERFARLS